MVDNEEYSSELVAFIRSDEAAEVLRSLSAEDLAEANTLSTVNSLRERFQLPEASLLLRTARLRQKAAAKFPWSGIAFFTQESMEQATAWTVALYHAEQIHTAAPPGPVLDLGCGIGGDTLALAQFRDVIAYERNPVRMAFAQANARALGLEDRIQFRLADWTQTLAHGELERAAAAFVDPSRRIDGRRIFHLDQMQPPIDSVLKLREIADIVAAKVMPSVGDEELPEDCDVEFISHQGICKEAVLWFGDVERDRRAASVHHNERWHSLASKGVPPPVGPFSDHGYSIRTRPSRYSSGCIRGTLCLARRASHRSAHSVPGCRTHHRNTVGRRLPGA